MAAGGVLVPRAYCLLLLLQVHLEHAAFYPLPKWPLMRPRVLTRDGGKILCRGARSPPIFGGEGGAERGSFGQAFVKRPLFACNVPAVYRTRASDAGNMV